MRLSWLLSTGQVRPAGSAALAVLAAVLTAGCPGGGDAGTDEISVREKPEHTGEPQSSQLSRPPLLIVGQDLDSIRGYFASGCCPAPDGVTAYVDFYNILSASGDYGGLGIDPSGNAIELENDWGGGPVNAYKTATEFGVGNLAVGLSITENDHPGELSALIAGEYDEEIRHLARMISMVRGTVYLRIGYEFDGAWNRGYENPERYKAAYRRIVDRLRAENADNVEYVWQASAAAVDDVLDRGHEDIRQWYPGDGYVHWMGLSWFMHPGETPKVASGHEPATLRQLSDEVLAYARKRGKPVMFAEAAPQAFDLLAGIRANHSPVWDGPAGENRQAVSSDEIWEAWFAPMFEYLDENKDVVRALAYINCNWDVQDLWNPPYESGFWGDTRLETNPEIAARFTAAIERWRGH